jgi:hypothetical protein
MSNRVSSVTWNHDEIRRWAEERGGVPAAPKGTARGKESICIDFPAQRGQRTLRPIGWTEFFDKFDDNRLALVYEEWNTRGQRSNVNRLVSRDHLEGSGTTTRRRRRTRRTRTMVAGHAVRARKASSARSRTRKTSTTRRPSARKSTRSRTGARRTSGVRRARSSTSGRTTRSRTPSRVARKGTARRRTGLRAGSRTRVASRRRRATRSSRRH